MDKEKILSKAKIGLMTKGSVFLCTIAFNLRYHWDKTKPTAGVDGVNMFINPDWFCSLEINERVGLLAHESWHVALDHVGEKGRRGDRDKKTFNHAGDYVINLLVTNAGMKIPPNGLLDSKYDGWSTNQVYDDLIKNGLPKKGQAIGAAGTGWGDDVLEGPGSPQEQQAQVAQLLVKAATASKMAGEKPGDIPAEIQRTIDDLINPVLPWDAILDRFLTDMAPEDYSWRRPNRRFMPDHYLPTKSSEALGHLIFAIDTSGSVTEKMMTEILSEIVYVKTKFNPKKLTILDCDTTIHNVYDVTENDDILDLNFSGGGGTRCAPPIEYAKKHHAEALLYFTDGGFTPYRGTVEFPLLWLIYDNPSWTTQIGEVIIYNGNQ